MKRFTLVMACLLLTCCEFTVETTPIATEVVYVENSLSNEEKLKQVANDLLPTQEDN